MADRTAPLLPHGTFRRYYRNEQQRREKIKEWFDAAAHHYDWITQVASFGTGMRYRRDALIRAGIAPGMSVLDVGSGTGTIAAEAQRIVGSSGLVVALDPSLGMLARAAARDVRRRTAGIAEALPFADGRFDLLTMGYALRHVADLRATFREYHRVLSPGGKVLLLEITPPSSRPAHRLLALYMGRMIPWLAAVGGGGRSARDLMRYYWDTIEHCVQPATILAALAEAGFSSPERHLQHGILSEYRAVRRAADGGPAAPQPAP
jgi:demethylmenaquinone methyltransferase/2-methoxy-6-polyprenyl-1,4-benzoquinol methylase